MKNTGIVYSSGEKTPVVLPELANLLPPLTDEQLAVLEQDIQTNGCYSPVIVNEDLVIVDGHNRRAVCEKLGVPYQMAVFHFDDTLEAMQWAVDTQKGRRNLDTWELGKIALKLKPALEAKGKANMSAGGGDRKSQDARQKAETSDTEDSGQIEAVTESGSQNSANPISGRVDTRKQLADSVGISHDTMGRIMKIDEQAPKAVKDALDNKEISVNQGYNITRQLQDVPEEEREAAAEAALEVEKGKRELRKSDAELDRRTKIAATFSKAYEKAILLTATKENVLCWVDCCRMRPEEIQENLEQSRELSRTFATIADILEGMIPADGETDVVEEAA